MNSDNGQRPEDLDTLGSRVAWAISTSPKSAADLARELADRGEKTFEGWKSQLTKWQKPDNGISIDNALKIAGVLGVDSGWLVSGGSDPYEHQRMAVVRHATTAEWQDLKKMLEAISGDGAPREDPLGLPEPVQEPGEGGGDQTEGGGGDGESDAA